MKVSERYQTASDAQQQLHNTYVELDGQLAHISYNSGWDWYVNRPVKAANGRTCWGSASPEDISECDLNLEPLKLGYMNYGDDCAFVQRKPLRKWKQGIYVDYLEMLLGDDDANNNGLKRKAPIQRRNQLGGLGLKLNPLEPGPISLGKLFNSSSVVDMYENRYPTFVRAYVEVYHLSVDARAWSREWAFRRIKTGKIGLHEIGLEYKGKRVGEVKHGKAILYAKYRYLTETFVEAMVHAS